MNYTTTGKKILPILFAHDKFHYYILSSHAIVFTEHGPSNNLRMPSHNLLDGLLLKDYDLEIRDKKGIENVVASHLSCLNFVTNVLPIRDSFPNVQTFSSQSTH